MESRFFVLRPRITERIYFIENIDRVDVAFSRTEAAASFNSEENMRLSFREETAVAINTCSNQD